MIYSENSENFYHDEKYRRRIFSVTNNSKNSKPDSSAKQAVSTSMDDLLVLRTQEARHSLVARHMRNSISSVKSSSELAIEELVGSYLICSLAIILYSNIYDICMHCFKLNIQNKFVYCKLNEPYDERIYERNWQKQSKVNKTTIKTYIGVKFKLHQNLIYIT